MVTNIKPWGNSQGLYLPKALLKEIGLAVNDSVELSVQDGTIIISKNNKLDEKAKAMENIRKIRNKIEVPKDFDYREEYYRYLDERYQV